MAERQGLRLAKSRLRDPHAKGFGEFSLIDAKTNVAVRGYSGSLRDLDAVEYFLTTRRAGFSYFADVDIPGGHSLGGAGSVTDLAPLLAHALVIGEKYGNTRPGFKAYAERDGETEDLTADEYKALTEAVERVLRDIRPSGDQ